MTYDEFFYGEFRERIDVRPDTWHGYLSAWRRNVSPRFGWRELGTLTAEEVEAWAASLSAGAARKAYAVLRTVTKRACKWHRLPLDPTLLGVELPHGRRYVPDTLDYRGLRALLRGFYGHDVEAVVLSSATLGLRPSEAYGLQRGDVDLRGGDVRIERTRMRVGGEVIVQVPKTDLSRRALVYPRFALERMRELCRGMRREEWLCPLAPDAIARRYKTHCLREGLPYVSLKNLRHSYATCQLEAGTSLEHVSMLLGHSEVTTTYRFYVRPRRKMAVEAQGRFERLLLRA